MSRHKALAAAMGYDDLKNAAETSCRKSKHTLPLGT
jgi:hypothetical protein